MNLAHCILEADEATQLAYVTAAEAAFQADIDLRGTDPDLRAGAVTHLRRSRLIKLLYNRVTVWLILHLSTKARNGVAWLPHSTAATVGSFRQLVEDLEVRWDSPAGKRQIEAKLEKRRLGRGQEPMDAVVRGEPGNLVPRGERPIKTLGQFKGRVRKSLQLLADSGHDGRISIVVAPPPKGNTSAIDWPATMDFPEDTPLSRRSLIESTFTGLRPALARQARVSWIQVHEGRLAIITPAGSVCYIGPYTSIVGQANKRLMQNPSEEDPKIWVIRHPDNREEDLTATTHREAVQEVFPDLDVNDLVKYGTACLFARGASVEYVVQARALRGDHTIVELIDFDERVQLAILDGSFVVRDDPKLPARSPGNIVCTSCGLEQNPRYICAECLCPLDTSVPDIPEPRVRLIMRIVKEALANSVPIEELEAAYGGLS